MKFERGTEYFESALQSLANALSNLNSVAAAEQDHYTFAQVYLLEAEICRTPAAGSWQGTDAPRALERYRRALNSLNQVPRKRKVVDSDIIDVRNKIAQLKPEQTAAQSSVASHKEQSIS